jgi:hypothetical protein
MQTEEFVVCFQWQEHQTDVWRTFPKFPSSQRFAFSHNTMLTVSQKLDNNKELNVIKQFLQILTCVRGRYFVYRQKEKGPVPSLYPAFGSFSHEANLSDELHAYLVDNQIVERIEAGQHTHEFGKFTDSFIRQRKACLPKTELIQLRGW